MSTTNQFLDVAWILVCAALVMLMQAGFSCLESGLVRSKNSINVAAKNFADFCLSSVVFWLFGFALMFGATSGGFFGTSGFLFDDTANPWLMAFFIFQLGFCGTAVTIVSGAVSERMRFAGYLVIATILSAVIYPLIGHWVWGSASGASSGGWLEQRGFIDFAGSTVVHSVGGWVALAAIIIIGPRIGRFGENSVPIHGHDLPVVTLGVFLLWFGWFGFNGGSTLGLTPDVPTIIVNTTVSGAFGGLVAMGLAWRLGGRPDVTMIMNGSLAGLVGITASAHIMTPVSAAGIGSIAAVVMYSVAMLLEKLEIDDVVGAVPVHLGAGIWGTLAVAIFGDPESWGTGLGRWDQLVVQATGVGAAFLWAFGLGFILLWLINRVYPLRIDPEGEQVGLNVAEHGASTEILDLLTEMDAQRRANDFSQPVNVEPHTEIGQIAQQYNRVIADINAEQRRREAATEALRQKTVSLELLQGAAAAANRAQTVHDAIQTCLEDISTFGGWAIGHCYMLDDATGELASAKIWHFDDAERFARFREVTENTTFESGVGLPGHVMASGDPAWVVDVSEDPNFHRGKKAENLGVKGAAAFPVLVEEDVVAVLEFFSREPMEPNETMLEVMASVGTQLGRVVERRRSETARFKSVVDNMPAHVHLRDQNGQFLLINRKYEEFYGITNDSARGKTLDEVHLDESFDVDLGDAGVHDREVIESNSIVEDNYTVTRKGVEHAIADVKFPVRDPSGKIIAVGGIELDITELKRAEEAVRESQQLLETILDHMPTPVYLRDLEGRFLLINRGYEKNHQVTKDGVNGKALGEVFPKDMAEDFGILDPEVIKQRQVLEREETMHLADGDHIMQVVKFPVFDLTGEVMAVGGIDIDITKRKRAEEAVRESELRFRQILRGSPIAVAIAIDDGSEDDGKIVFSNDRLAELLGGSAEKLLETRSSAFLPEGEVRTDLERMLQHGADIRDREATLRRLDGSDFWSLLSVSAMDYKKRKSALWWIYDITERKKGELFLRTVVDTLPAALSIRDTEGRFVLTNRLLADFYGLEPEGLVGRLSTELYSDAENKEITQRELQQILTEGVPTGGTEQEYRLPDGTYEYWLTTRELILDDDGRILYVLTVSFDITDRKRAEDNLQKSREQLQALADNLPELISMKDSDGRFIFVNKQFEEWVCRSRNDVVGKTVHNIYPEEQATEFAALDRQAIDGRKILSQEVDLDYPDGQRRTIIRTRFPVISSQGEVLGLGTVNRDITDRKRAEDELQAAYGIIKDQKERMEDELNVGHEIQMSMIPLKFPPFPDHDEFSIYAALEPAREVGGDFYDYYFLDEERFCFCIGDVSGKGVPAALFMAMTKTLIKSRAADDRSTASILTHVNDELSRNNKSCMFVTTFAGILNVKTGELLYTNAGHNPPYIRRKDGALQRLDKRHGPAIAAMEGMVYKEERDILEPGDLLFLYTDGVTEAMDIENHLFSEDRLKDLLVSLDTDDADTAVDHTVTAVRVFEGEAEQADDITVLALKYQGKPEDALLAEQRVTIKNRMADIAAVKETFESFTEEFGIPATIGMKFGVIFDELLNNIVTYAYSDDDEHDIEVRMELAGKRLTVTIADDGVPFNPLSAEAPDIDASLEERKIGGLGIHLVRNLIDDVTYHRRIGENVMTLTRHLE